MSNTQSGFFARVKRFFQSLTGSGVTSYDDAPLPGANDGGSTQGNAETQMRNRLNTTGNGS